MGTFTNREKAAEAEREVVQRERVYSRLIDQGKMNAYTARRQILMMKEIAADYTRLAEEAGEPIGALL